RGRRRRLRARERREHRKDDEKTRRNREKREKKRRARERAKNAGEGDGGGAAPAAAVRNGTAGAVSQNGVVKSRIERRKNDEEDGEDTVQDAVDQTMEVTKGIVIEDD
ncbi:hypothetical protein EKO27_g11853, partial [Xylaria grammica]